MVIKRPCVKDSLILTAKLCQVAPANKDISDSTVMDCAPPSCPAR